MAFSLSDVVPWGRNLSEYLRMFALDDGDLDRRIVGCADGPASFNAEMAAAGAFVLSVDPLYGFPADAIMRRIEETFETVLDGMKDNRDAYNLPPGVEPEHVAATRLRAMKLFLQDLPGGLEEGRYLDGSLPELPIPDDIADLALCSHFLFTYSNVLDLPFHLDAILEMRRIAAEVRVFPVIDMSGQASPHLEPVCDGLARRGFKAELVQVPYELQRGGHTMLRVT